MPGSEWAAILANLRVRHTGVGQGEDYTMTIELERGGEVNVGECIGFYLHRESGTIADLPDAYALWVTFPGHTSHLLRSTALRINGSSARLTFSLLPYLKHISPDLGNWRTNFRGGQLWTEPHEVLDLALSVRSGQSAPSDMTAFRRLLSTSDRTIMNRAQILAVRTATEELQKDLETSYLEELRSLLRNYIEHLPPIPKRLMPRIAEDFRAASEAAGLNEHAQIFGSHNSVPEEENGERGREGN